MSQQTPNKGTGSIQRKGWHWGSYLSALSPFLVLFAALAIYALTYNVLINCAFLGGNCNELPNLAPSIDKLLEKQKESESVSNINGIAGRINWAVATGLNFLISIITLVLAWYIALRASRYYVRSPALRAIFPFILLAISLPIGLTTKKIMSSSIDVKNPWEHFLHYMLRIDFPAIEKFTKSMDAVSVVFSIYLALSISALLISSIHKEEEWFEEIATHTYLLNISLYVGALFLVVGTFRVATLFEWSWAYIDATAFDVGSNELRIYNDLSHVAKGIINSRGVLYSSMLASIYIPAALFIHGRVQEAKKRGKMLAENEKDWLQQWSFSSLLPRIIAVLGPALSSPAADYLQVFR